MDISCSLSNDLDCHAITTLSDRLMEGAIRGVQLLQTISHPYGLEILERDVRVPMIQWWKLTQVAHAGMNKG
eukprot:485971-Amorphochlora_amoeboformis.AAC.2